jgi:hypothetical protein
LSSCFKEYKLHYGNKKAENYLKMRRVPLWWT